MSEDFPEPAQWTTASAERLIAAAHSLTEEIAAHAQAVAALDPNDLSGLVELNDALVPPVVAYADAQIEHTGTGWPLIAVEPIDEDDEDDEDDETAPDEPGDVIAVLQRHDYRMADLDAIFRAGRAAYLRMWPDDTEQDAADDVTHAGRALYQIAHADGWDQLARVEGLAPLGGVVLVLKPDAALDLDDDDGPPTPDQLIPEDGELLYSQVDVWES